MRTALLLTMLLATPTPNAEQQQIAKLTAIAAAQQQQITALQERVAEVEKRQQEQAEAMQELSDRCGKEPQP